MILALLRAASSCRCAAAMMKSGDRSLHGTGAMSFPRIDWNRAFEFTWRILVFIVAVGIIIVVSTNWTR